VMFGYEPSKGLRQLRLFRDLNSVAYMGY
jgi:hypothetical protein